jgi:hypothetical protein
MAETHVELDEGTGKHPRTLMDAARKVQNGLNDLQSEFNAMDRMKSGDGSLASHFQEVVDLYGVQSDEGFTALERAKTLYDELNSALGNIAALKQFLAIVG